MPKIRARIECTRPGCEASHEYWANVRIKTETASYMSTEVVAEMVVFMPDPEGSEYWIEEGRSGSEQFVCPSCQRKDRCP